MTIKKCALVASLVLFFGLSVATCAAWAQTYPVKPIRLILGYAVGGGADVMVRALSIPLGELLGQPIIIDTRLGAGGIIATEAAAKAPPDGYTLHVGSAASFAINPNLVPKIPYDPVKDFTPIGYYATFSYVMVVDPSLPAKNLAEFISTVTSRPELFYGSAGSGTSTHIATEQLLSMAGLKMPVVHYKGNTPAMTALLGKEVAMVFDPVVTSAPRVKAGKLRALGVTTLKRSVLMPDVPTLSEAGVKGFEASNWQAVFGPAGTPKAIVEKLNASINTVMNRPDMKEKLLAQGADGISGSPDDLARLVQVELVKFQEIIKKAAIKPE